MTNEDWEVDDGALAMAVIINLIDHLISTDALSRQRAETVLLGAIATGRGPAAKKAAHDKLKKAFPYFDLGTPPA